MLTKTIDKTIDGWIYSGKKQKVHRRVIACEPFSYLAIGTAGFEPATP